MRHIKQQFFRRRPSATSGGNPKRPIAIDIDLAINTRAFTRHRIIALGDGIRRTAHAVDRLMDLGGERIILKDNRHSHERHTDASRTPRREKARSAPHFGTRQTDRARQMPVNRDLAMLRQRESRLS